MMAHRGNNAWGRVMTRFVGLLICVLTLASAPARAEDVDVAIVLVSDVSRSVNDGEYKLMKDGYAAAFTSQAVLTAIRGGALGAIAVTYVEFAGASEVRTVIDWRVISDRVSAEVFAEALIAAPRSFWGRTAIGEGIDHGMRMLDRIGHTPLRRVIDVCGDGTSNSGREVTEARDDAVAQGVIINALAIINDSPFPWAQAHVNPPGGLLHYFRENVIGGPGAFALETRDFARFGEAMTRKLVMEIAGRPSPSNPRLAGFDQPHRSGGLSGP